MTDFYDFPDLKMLARDCLVRAGVGDDAACALARDVALAEAFGQGEHGFNALLRDIRLIRYGRIHPDAAPVISTPTAAIVRVDAAHGLAAAALRGGVEPAGKAATDNGIAMLHLVRSSDPGIMGGAMLDLACRDLAVIAVQPGGVCHVIGPGGETVTQLSSKAPGMLDTLLSIAPAAADLPGGDAVNHAAWLTVLDPGATAAQELLADLPIAPGAIAAPATQNIAVAPDLLAQIVNA